MATRSELEAQLRVHWTRLRRFALALSRDRSDADDLVQDVAIRAIGAAGKWQPGTRFDSWMFRIARNLWIDTVRATSRRNRGRAPVEEVEALSVDGPAAVESAIDLKRAMAAMQRLPVEQREVVALVLIDGYGYREAAELLGLPIGTVSSRLVRGRQALLELLGGTGDD